MPRSLGSICITFHRFTYKAHISDVVSLLPASAGALEGKGTEAHCLGSQCALKQGDGQELPKGPLIKGRRGVRNSIR